MKSTGASAPPRSALIIAGLPLSSVVRGAPATRRDFEPTLILTAWGRAHGESFRTFSASAFVHLLKGFFDQSSCAAPARPVASATSATAAHVLKSNFVIPL